MKIDITFRDASPELIVQWVKDNFKDAAESAAVTYDAASLSATDTASVEFDKNGLPWDERIHSSSRKLTAKGEWARRKNISDEFFANVEAELKGRSGQDVAALALDALVNQDTPTGSLPIPAWLQSQSAALPAAVAAPAPQIFDPNVAFASIQSPVEQSKRTFAELMNLVSMQFQTGKLSCDDITLLNKTISDRFGVKINAIVDVQERDDMIQFAFEHLQKEGKTL